MYEDIIITAFYWSLYLVVHSLLASEQSKLFCQKYFPVLFKRYRLLYNLVAMIGITLILWHLASTPSKHLFSVYPATKYIGLVFASWGLILIKVSFRHYSSREFLGFSQSKEVQPLVTNGLLKHIRHPIYSGTILILAGFFMYIPNILNLVSVLCIYVYLYFGIRSEETKLVKIYGEDYLEYKKQTPALMPRLFR